MNIAEFNSKQKFVRDACPANWLDIAEELCDAAELVWKQSPDRLRLEAEFDANFDPIKDVRIISPASRMYILLAGFALENVLKGLLVQEDPSHVNTGKISDTLHSHDLIKILSACSSLALSDAERDFCNVASKALVYWGRYPIPLRHSQVTPEVGIDEERRQVFLSLFNRLAHKLYWSTRDGWDSKVGAKTLKHRSVRYGDRIDTSEALT